MYLGNYVSHFKKYHTAANHILADSWDKHYTAKDVVEEHLVYQGSAYFEHSCQVMQSQKEALANYY